MVADLPRLRDTLGAPELSWLLERARRRLELGGPRQGTVTLRDPTAAQRAAVDRLLGRAPSRGEVLSVPLDELDRIVRHAELADGLDDAVAALTGPLVDERAARAAVERDWDALFAGAAELIRRDALHAETADLAGRRHALHAEAADLPGRRDALHAEAADLAGQHDALLGWLGEVRAGGLLRRLAGGDVAVGRRLLRDAVAVAVRLPAGGVPLAELAAAGTGDSHALDAGAAVGTLAVRAAAAVGGAPTWEGAEGRRDAWACAGVLCDELSAPALVLALTADGRTATGRALGIHAEAGEPYRLSVRQLLRDPPAFPAAAVFVCENPSVVAAAANRLGADCAPLVCVEGQVRTAARLLLHRLAGAGARLRYHGDFDWAGVGIANRVIARHGAAPWRLSARDYTAAAGGPPLIGRPVDPSWDADLAPAMRRRGRAVHEEQVLGDLLTDLAG